MTIGIDLGDRKSHLCVLDASGEVVEESQLATTPKAVGARFEGLTSARVARMDPKLLYPIEHRDRCARADLSVMRSRDALVATRTKLVNHIHGVLESFGHRVKKHAAPGFHRQVLEQIPDELHPSLQPVLDTLAALAGQILVLDREMRRLSTATYPETSLLSQVGGVGPITGTSARTWA